MVVDRRRYGLELDRVRLLMLRALGADSPKLRDELASIDTALSALPVGRVDRLARQLALTTDDMSLMWSVVAASHDPRCAPHAAALGGASHAGGASLSMHVQIIGLDISHARELALRLRSDHPLLRDGLLVADDGGSPASRVLRASDRFAAFLAGGDQLDSTIVEYGGLLVPPEAPSLDDEHRRLIAVLVEIITSGQGVVMLEGTSGVGRRTLAAIAGAEARRPIVYVDIARVPSSVSALSHVLDAVRRETALRPDAVVLLANVEHAIDPNVLDGGRSRILARTVSSLGLPVILTTSATGAELPLAQTPLRLRVHGPSTEVRLALWRQAVGESDTIALEAIAERYQIGPGTIASGAVAAAIMARAKGDGAITERDLVDGIRATIAERMGGLAYRVETTEQWNDLVMTPDTLDQIRTLIARVQHATEVLDGWGFRARLPRGAGVAALFSGPPGTGKTMVAGLIARELDLELYQVDLSRVVSKWVGETEKQLASIFDAAEAGHALLLFDEADALFAKRTEVKAAVDRYANLEVNYLLQRVEAFGGATILTTNMDTSIDPALKRRLAAHIVFWPPDEEERMALWAKMIPARAPRDGELDFAELARAYPDMAGANIRNAAVAAAFLAAAERSVLRHAHLQRAARLEYRSMGRVLGKREDQ